MSRESSYIFGPMSPTVMTIPKKKKHRKAAKTQREALALNLAHTIMNLMGDGKSVVMLTTYDIDTGRIIREGD